MRVLVYANAPVVPTGFGTVIRNIFGGLIDRGLLRAEDVMFFGVNYQGEPHGTPFNIWPAQVASTHDPDLYGRQRFAFMVLQGAFDPFDVLFILEDHFTVAMPIMFPDNKIEPFLPGLIQRLRATGRIFRTVQYVPVDSETVRPEWVTYMPEVIDVPVAYTEFGRRVLLELAPGLASRIRVIPHGTNPELFFPVSDEERNRFRKTVLHIEDGVPLIVNVNRNQPRKDVPRTLQVFSSLRLTVPTARLYLHMNVRDSAGFDLDRIRLSCGLPQETVLFPDRFSEGVGVPVQILNLIYNAADIVLTTARGEGFGLTTAEAMTAGVLVVAPAHTSLIEVIGDRGVLVPCEPYPAAIVLDNDQLRPVADVPALAAACAQLWRERHTDAVLAMRARARVWGEAMAWPKAVVPLWAQVLGLGVPDTPPAQATWNARARHAA